MPTITEVQDAIYDWLEPACAPAPVDWENEDDADRKDTRVAIRLQEGAAQPHPVTTVVDGVEGTTEVVLLTLVINTRGRDAQERAQKIRASLWASQRSGFDALWKYVGLSDASAIANLSALESAQVGPRYEFRVKLFTALVHDFAADQADTVAVAVNQSASVILGNDPRAC